MLGMGSTGDHVIPEELLGDASQEPTSGKSFWAMPLRWWRLRCTRDAGTVERADGSLAALVRPGKVSDLSIP